MADEEEPEWCGLRVVRDAGTGRLLRVEVRELDQPTGRGGERPTGRLLGQLPVTSVEYRATGNDLGSVVVHLVGERVQISEELKRHIDEITSASSGW